VAFLIKQLLQLIRRVLKDVFKVHSSSFLIEIQQHFFIFLKPSKIRTMVKERDYVWAQFKGLGEPRWSQRTTKFMTGGITIKRSSSSKKNFGNGCFSEFGKRI
jgi:hypothetical protein